MQQKASHWVPHLPCSHDLSHPKYITEMSINVPAKYTWAILVSFTSQIVVPTLEAPCHAGTQDLPNM